MKILENRGYELNNEQILNSILEIKYMTVDEIIDRLLEQMIQPGQPSKAILTYGPAIPIANKKKEEEEDEEGNPPKELPWSKKERDFVQDCKVREDIIFINDYLKKLYFDD